MAAIRFSSFNAENFFARYSFNKDIDPQKAVIDGWRADAYHGLLRPKRSTRRSAPLGRS